MPYEPPEIDTDQDAVTNRILTGMMDRLPGWAPVEGAPEVALAEEIGRETAATNTRVVDVIGLAVAGMGETAFGVAGRLGTPATMTVTLSVTGAGAVVGEGFTVVGLTAAGAEVAFQLLEPVTSAGDTVNVTMTALDDGTVGNGVPPGSLTIVSATAVVLAATTSAGSSGGVDAETFDQYLGRFSDYISILRPGGVRGADLAQLARTVAGVNRALGIDLYDPAAPLVDTERTATVFVMDTTGAPVPAAVAANVQSALEAVREINFVVHVEDPTYTPVAIVYTATAEAGADAGVVKTNIDAALAAYLDPATWGDSELDDQAWTETTIVRYLDVVRVAGGVAGIATLDTLTVNGGTIDVTLAGPAAVPKPLTGVTPSTITGTVT